MWLPPLTLNWTLTRSNNLSEHVYIFCTALRKIGDYNEFDGLFSRSLNVLIYISCSNMYNEVSSFEIIFFWLCFGSLNFTNKMTIFFTNISRCRIFVFSSCSIFFMISTSSWCQDWAALNGPVSYIITLWQ